MTFGVSMVTPVQTSSLRHPCTFSASALLSLLSARFSCLGASTLRGLKALTSLPVSERAA
jgi:hypothetical protein